MRLRRLPTALSEGVPGLPEHRQQDDRRHPGEPGAEIREFGTQEPQSTALHEVECDADDERREPRLPQSPPTVDDDDEQERHEEDEGLQQQHEHPREVQDVHTADIRADDDRDADRPVGAGSDVGDEADHGGLYGPEAELHQQRRADGDRHAESCRSFEEGAEREGDEQHLDALIRRDAADRSLNHIEVPARHGEPVQPHGHHDDVGDRPQRVQQAVQPRAGCGARRHPEGPERDHDLGDDRDDRGDDTRQLKHDEADQEQHDRQGRHDRGEPQDAKRVRRLSPHERLRSWARGESPAALTLPSDREVRDKP